MGGRTGGWGGGGLQVLGGARREVQLCGVTHEVNGPMVKRVPRWRPCFALVIYPGVASVIRLAEALIERHTTLSTCNINSEKHTSANVKRLQNPLRHQ